MNIAWNSSAWEDYVYWQTTDKKTLKKINELIKDILRDPYSGIGKPELLKHSFQGRYSRRITLEHRLIYIVVEDTIIIEQCRYHYL